ncbi:unnamed protein product [Ectocarpus sp. 8 AP-2014]
MCRDLCARSQHSRFHHGAVTVLRRGHRMLGKGSNRHNAHAEVSSIKAIPQYQRHDNLVVYVCRVNSSGRFMNSRPCVNCLTFMKANHVTRVFFTDGSGFTKINL